MSVGFPAPLTGLACRGTARCDFLRILVCFRLSLFNFWTGFCPFLAQEEIAYQAGRERPRPLEEGRMEWGLPPVGAKL